jgi:hypothetical protein
MYYIKTSDGSYIETLIQREKIPLFNRDTKVFKLSNGSIMKTNNFKFLNTVKNVPEGSIRGEILWEYKDSDVTDFIVY